MSFFFRIKFFFNGYIFCFIINRTAVLVGPYNKVAETKCTQYDYKTGLCKSREYEVFKLIRHDDYDKDTLANDIGLIQLEEDVLFTKFNEPACLPQPGYFQWNFEDIVFGQDRPNDIFGTDDQKIFNLQPFNFFLCQEKFRTKFKREMISYDQFCAIGKEEQDVCINHSGPSNSALYFNFGIWNIIGIVVYDYECEFPGWPGVYTNVGDHLYWIEETMIDYLSIARISQFDKQWG